MKTLLKAQYEVSYAAHFLVLAMVFNAIYFATPYILPVLLPVTPSSGHGPKGKEAPPPRGIEIVYRAVFLGAYFWWILAKLGPFA